MSVVLDSSVLIDVLRRDPRALRFLSGLAGRPHASEISRVEVARGVRSHERAAAADLFAQLHWQPVDETVARHAGSLGRTYRRSHTGLAVADLVVAATAVLADLPLATSNVRHFPMFADLAAPY